MILLTGCDSDQIFTYEMGLANCKKISEENGGEGIFLQPKFLEGFSIVGKPVHNT